MKPAPPGARVMNIYEFHLIFALPGVSEAGSKEVAFALHDSPIIGDQISVGFGRKGRLSISAFIEELNADDAIKITISEVERIIPRACVAEVGPDLLNLTGLAEVFSCTRQNMRKYASDEYKDTRQAFPLPAVTTDGQMMWHLFQVADWLKRNTKISVSGELIEVAQATAHMNAMITEKTLNGDRFSASQITEQHRYTVPIPSFNPTRSFSRSEFQPNSESAHHKIYIKT